MEPQINVENQNLGSNLSQPTKNPYKILFFVFFALFLVTSSILSTTLILQNKSQLIQRINNQGAEIIPTQSIISEPTSISATTQSDVSNIPNDWQTYTDSTYKFSISYPSNWTLNKTKEGISLETPEHKKEIERQTEELKQSESFGEGSNAPGKYYISCFQSLTDLRNSNFGSATIETNSTALYNFLLENSYPINDMSGFKYFRSLKILNIDGRTLYQVENEGPVPNLSVFIQNKNLSICEINLSGITTEEISEIESKFINTFKFN